MSKKQYRGTHHPTTRATAVEWEQIIHGCQHGEDSNVDLNRFTIEVKKASTSNYELSSNGKKRKFQ